MKFGDNLKLIRKNKNMSQELLAEKMNVSRQSVSKWENGEAYPEMHNILQLCKIFNCKINDSLPMHSVRVTRILPRVHTATPPRHGKKRRRFPLPSPAARPRNRLPWKAFLQPRRSQQRRKRRTRDLLRMCLRFAWSEKS